MKQTGIATAVAPGKVILTGEHFVVLGASALSMAIDLYSVARTELGSSNSELEVDISIPTKFVGERDREDPLKPGLLLKPLRAAAGAALREVNGAKGGRVQVECNIPLGAGLGSSASTSVAIIASVVAAKTGKMPPKQRIFELAYTPERLIHARPSGVDQATSTYGGMIQYIYPGKVETVRPGKNLPLLICDSGIHRSTGPLVGAVVDRSESKEKKRDYRGYVALISQITRRARRAVEDSDFPELGWLMNWNQDLLVRIGVSHPKLDHMLQTARGAGALGAKLTGAGGGGCIIALCEDEKSSRAIAKKLVQVDDAKVYRVGISREGVRLVS